jgi:hypothetical protein
MNSRLRKPFALLSAPISAAGQKSCRGPPSPFTTPFPPPLTPRFLCTFFLFSLAVLFLPSLSLPFHFAFPPPRSHPSSLNFDYSTLPNLPSITSFSLPYFPTIFPALLPHWFSTLNQRLSSFPLFTNFSLQFFLSSQNFLCSSLLHFRITSPVPHPLSQNPLVPHSPSAPDMPFLFNYPKGLFTGSPLSLLSSFFKLRFLFSFQHILFA